MALNDINALIAKLETLKKEAVAQIPPMLGDIVLLQTERSFEQERFAGENGGKWPDRRAFGGEENILYPKLQFKGSLRRSFRKKIVKISPLNSQIYVGTNKPYAQAHNEGIMPPAHTGRRYKRRGDVRQGNWSYSGKPYKRQFLGIGNKTIVDFRLSLDKYFRYKTRKV